MTEDEHMAQAMALRLSDPRAAARHVTAATDIQREREARAAREAEVERRLRNLEDKLGE